METNKQAGQRKIIGYCRVSTSKQESGLDAQCQAILDFAIREEREVVEIVEERVSGSQSDRPGLAHAISVCAETEATLVIAKLDRLSREVKHLFALKDAGVEFQALDVPELNTLTLGVLASFAQHEREQISERTRAGLEAARRRGVRLGSPALISRACIEASATARKEKAMQSQVNLTGERHIRLFLREGNSLSAIARKLTELEIPTQKGGKWTAQAVKRLIALYEIEVEK